jgi:CheY-like chemotaxis protein
MSKLRILLAEDHETVREGLRLIVNAQSDMEVVGEAGDGREALARAQELLPDIVVMDVSMPQLNGLKATEKLKQVCPQVKVLTLTRHTDYGYLQQLLRAGASGYVPKQSPPPNCFMPSAPSPWAANTLTRRSRARSSETTQGGRPPWAAPPKEAASFQSAKRKSCASSRGATATKRSPPASA